MNPVIYMGTQAKYRLAMKILFCGEKQTGFRCGSYRRTSTSEAGPGYGGAKFYVRQMSSSTTTPELEQQQNSDRERIQNGKKIKRQVSFR